MAAFATAAELATYMGATVDPTRANLALDLASDQLRAEVGWSVNEETDTIELDGSGRSYVFLPYRPVTAITEIIEEGVLLATDDYSWNVSGAIQRKHGRWTCELRGVVVTATYGFADGEVPGIFRALALDAAARALSNPGSILTGRTVGGTAENLNITPTMITPGDARLARYRVLSGVS